MNTTILSVMRKVATAANVPLYYGTFEERPALVVNARVQALVAFFPSVNEAERAGRSVMPHATIAFVTNAPTIEKVISGATSCEEVLGSGLKEAFGAPDWRKNVRLRAVRWRGVLLNASLVARAARPLLMEPVAVCLGSISTGGYIVFRTPDYVAVTMGMRDEGDLAPNVFVKGKPFVHRGFRVRQSSDGTWATYDHDGDFFGTFDSADDARREIDRSSPAPQADELAEQYGGAMARKMRARRRR